MLIELWNCYFFFKIMLHSSISSTIVEFGSRVWNQDQLLIFCSSFGIYSSHHCHRHWKDMHWVRLKIYILIRFRESTQHTNPKSTKYCLFDAKGLPRKYSQSIKTLKFTTRQCTKPNNFVDQLKVWSSTYKSTIRFWSRNHTTASSQ